MWAKLASGIIGPVSGFFTKREERKMANAGIKAKVIMAKNNNETQVTFNEQEIDRLAKQNEGDTWKDEYITVIMTMPLVISYISTFVGILINNPLIIEASNASLAQTQTLLPDYQELLGIVILAALGYRAYKAK